MHKHEAGICVWSIPFAMDGEPMTENSREDNGVLRSSHLPLQQVVSLNDLTRRCHRHAWPVHSRIHPHVDTATRHRSNVREAAGDVRMFLTGRLVVQVAEFVFFVFQILVAVTADFAICTRFVDAAMSIVSQ